MKLKMNLLFAFLLAATFVTAQTKAPENWFNLDATQNGVNGVSTERTYQELLKDRKSTTVIVAVIDGGVDYNHEDLRDIMWTNTREIAGNGIDDDKNGFIDDIHGWNFIGGADGKNVHHETLEMTRVYAALKPKYGTMDSIAAKSLGKKERKEYEKFVKIGKEITENVEEAKTSLGQIDAERKNGNNIFDALEKALGSKTLTKENIEAINTGSNVNLKNGKAYLLNQIKRGRSIKSIAEVRDAFMERMNEAFEYYNSKANYQYNADLDTRRDIVKDNYADAYQHNYGNADMKGPDAFHGTHVAGIIGAVRNNNKGIKGVADNVRIMGIRCVPDGDERDKDVANAIIYAVDNGATVINMSFGKSYSWNKEAVDRAVKYAAKHDVLLVHAAGNDSKDNDSAENNNFPTATYERVGWFSPKKAKNWIEVGALSWKKDSNSVAEFSNFGQKNVDVFSPGVDIYSTTPESKYKDASGTSMASPVTAGVAAMIRSYFPELTAEQVKEVIENSSVKQSLMVKKPGTEDLVPFSSLSKTGGTVNAFEAVKAAMQMKGKKKVVNKV